MKTTTTLSATGAERVVVEMSFVFEGSTRSSEEAATLARAFYQELLASLKTMRSRPTAVETNSISGYANNGDDEVFVVDWDRSDEIPG